MTVPGNKASQTVLDLARYGGGGGMADVTAEPITSVTKLGFSL